MLGRNPWPLLTTLIAVAAVRIAWSHRMAGQWHWAVILRIAVVFAAISVLFNVLTVRSGDREIGRLPETIPLVGGTLTLNAVVYGLLSGCALVLLVLVGTTAAALLDWAAIIRLLPAGLTTIAVAGSIAFTLLPQTAIAFREIREAQLARGHRIRRARDFLPIIVPMLNGGMERAITLAEALESRGFGAANPAARVSNAVRYAAASALGMGALAAYALATGHDLLTLIAAAAALALLAPVIINGRRTETTRTRYRASRWTRSDSAVAIAAAGASAACVATLSVSPSALQYEPYPHLTLPLVGLPLLGALLGLLVPAFVAPHPANRGSST